MFRHVLLLITREGFKKKNQLNYRWGSLPIFFVCPIFFLFYSVTKSPCQHTHILMEFFWNLPFIRKVEFSWRMHDEISVMLPIRIVNQLTLDCITNVNLHSSHFLISLLFIHLTTKTIKHQSNLFLGKVQKSNKFKSDIKLLLQLFEK